MTSNRRVAVGRIGRPHGVGGEVRVDPRGGLPQGLRGYRTLYLGRSEEDSAPVAMESCRRHGRFLVVRFAGCATPEDARRLTHLLLFVDRDEMPQLGEDEYYHVDLLGCRVVAADGAELGVVDDVFTAGNHDVLVLRDGGAEWLLPVVAEFIVRMDVQRGEIVATPPPGLRP